MPYDGSTWDETNPTNATPANEIDDIAIDIKKGISGRMNKEHAWPTSQASTASGGTHTYLTFSNQTAAPTLPVVLGTTQAAGIYFLTNNGYILDSAGTSRVFFTSGVGLSIIGARYSAIGTQGDLIVGTTGGVIKAITASAVGTVLTSNTNTGDPSWKSPSAIGPFISSDWVSKSSGTTYQATSDGFFILNGTTAGGGTLHIRVLSDSAASPTTVRAQAFFSATGAGAAASCTIPVRKNDYYSSIVTGNLVSAWFIPMGV